MAALYFIIIVFITGIRPLGFEVGDFDLYLDPRDGKGYFIADRVHTAPDTSASGTSGTIIPTARLTGGLSNQSPSAALVRRKPRITGITIALTTFTIITAKWSSTSVMQRIFGLMKP